ncbi:hypothetical protein GS448_25940 [Rhodococcus hoagii]|nr:hypothetical protein [Prescottella equi]
MTNVETGVQMPLVGWRLGYDRAAVAGVLAVAEMDVADGIACAVSGEGDGLDLVRDIVQAMGCSSLWTCGTGDRDRVDVLADFTCDGEGFMVNDHHLTLSVYLHTGAVIADCGLRRLTDLPRAKFETVYDVLDGVTALLNEVVERAARALVVQEPPAALPLQVVPLSDLRTAVAEDLSIPAAEALAVSAASDDVLAQALRDSWGLVEERFFDLRAELIVPHDRS